MKTINLLLTCILYALSINNGIAQNKDSENRISLILYFSLETGKIVHSIIGIEGNVPLSDELDSKKAITIEDINKLETLLLKEYYFDVTFYPCRKNNMSGKVGMWHTKRSFFKLAEE
jgi:hypothetical protein